MTTRTENHTTPEAGCVVLEPPGLVLMSVVGLFALALFLGYMWVMQSDEFSATGRLMLPVGAVGISVVAADAVQRRYEITRSRARIRLLGVWRTVDLSSVDTLVKTPLGQLAFSISNQRRAIFRLPREYSTAETIRRLEQLWQRGLTCP